MTGFLKKKNLEDFRKNLSLEELFEKIPEELLQGTLEIVLKYSM